MQHTTEPRFNYFRSTSKLLQYFTIIWSAGLCFPATAQTGIIEVQLADSPDKVYIDRPGDLYMKSGARVVRFDISGKISGTWQLPHASVQFEPRDGSRMFYFNAADKTWGFAGFGKTPTSPLPEEYAVEPLLACSSGDLGIWILDGTDHSFKHVNLRKGQVDMEFYLPENLHNKPLLNIREYQSFLFVATENQLYIFSPFGKLLKTLQTSGSDFDFLGEELYYRKQNRLVFLNLFDGSERYEEIDPEIRFVRLTDERRFEIYSNRLVIRPAQ